MTVIKRDGKRETVKFDKITSRIEGVVRTFNGLEATRRARLTESRDADGAPALDIDPVMVSQKVCSALVDGIKSEDIDRVAAEVAQSLCLTHPDYSVLAGLMCISNLHKCTANTFSEYAESVYTAGVLSEETISICRSNSQELQALLDDSHDYAYDFFAYKTLEKSYLTKEPVTRKVLERPQYMWLRVAIGIHGNDLVGIAETYGAFVTGRFTHASPTLFNAGTTHPQLASCFLLEVEDDSMEGIFDTLKDCAMISKYAGGLGLHISKIRGNGSHIAGTNGTSSGIVPMCSVFEKTLKFSDQSSKRAGSAAMYLEPWHVDVEDFLELRLPTGAEERRCRDLFTAMFINDLFMRRVKANATWSLFNEHTTPGLCDAFGEEFDALYERYEAEGKWVKQVNAQDIWLKMCYSAIMTGTPYITFKDAVNRKTNQSNIGVIKSSNLCVAPETMILTEKGTFPIVTLANQVVKVWNGKEFSETTVVKTGEGQKLITVELSNGTSVECTEYHKFHIQPNFAKTKAIVVDAKDLVPGMKLIKFSLPSASVDSEWVVPETFNSVAYTHGLFCADGTYDKVSSKQERCAYTCVEGKNTCSRHLEHSERGGLLFTSQEDGDTRCCAMYKDKPKIYLYGEKMDLLKHLTKLSVSDYDEDNDKMTVYLRYDTDPKFKVPVNHPDITYKIQWLMGYSDGDGCITNNAGCQSLQLASIHKEFLVNILYMLQSIGVESKVLLMKDAGETVLPDGKGGTKKYKCKAIYRLIVASAALSLLVRLGFDPKRLKVATDHKTNRSSTHFTKVVSVTDEGRVSDTYCFNELKEHKGVFNGNLLGNCNEILQVSTPTETAVCNLASVNPVACIDRETKTFDFDKLGQSVAILVRNLNKVIDRTFYPTEKCRRSNFRHRPMGIGLSGLHTAFMVLRYPFESPEARQLNREIYECMYYHAIKESCDLAKVHGPYETFAGSPLSEGRFQFDLWGVTPSDQYDWAALRADVMTHGVRNSLLLACMPTASSASIIGNSESNDPVNSNLYSRKISAGEYALVNRFLVDDLIKAGLWTQEVKDQLLASEGSVQDIDGVPDSLKALYRTCFEMSMKSVIEMSADRGAFICQSQSLNLFMTEPTAARVSSMLFYSWSKGLKTGMYYLRTKARGSAAKFTIDPDLEKAAKAKREAAAAKGDDCNNQEAAVVCRRDDPDCLACSA